MRLPPSALPGISPSRGEIGCCDPSLLLRAFTSLHCSAKWDERWCALPISPLEGEMPGRAEGGVAIGKTL